MFDLGWSGSKFLRAPSSVILPRWYSPGGKTALNLRHNHASSGAPASEAAGYPHRDAPRRPLNASVRTHSGATMNFDEEKIDRTVLALLYLTLHDENRAWKSFDRDVMNRLHDKGFIFDPVNKAKSVLLTEEGLAESKRLFEELFGKA